MKFPSAFVSSIKQRISETCSTFVNCVSEIIENNYITSFFPRLIYKLEARQDLYEKLIFALCQNQWLSLARVRKVLQNRSDI